LGSSQAWPVAGARTLTIGGSLGGTAFLTLAGPGAILFDGRSGAIYSFGTSTTGNNALHVNDGTATIVSGTMTLGSNSNSTDGLHINGNSFFSQSGGTVNSSFYTRLGSGGAGTTSQLNVSGGTFKSTGEILFGFGGSGSGTLTVSGSGVVDARFLRLDDTSAAGTHTVNLDGGLLQANNQPSTPWFAASVANVQVKNGGAFSRHE